MGIVNVTPDSFSDGGQLGDVDQALAHALALIEAGADIIDIGGESTRPGAAAVAVDEELRRVIPLIERLAAATTIPISIDTSKADVMRAAVKAGAGMINDVHALRRPGALDAAADTGAAICLMHMQGEPGSMQAEPSYDDVCADIQRFFTDRILACQFAGIDKKRLAIDPGFGFGKTLAHNLELLARLDSFQVLGCPILAGLSRKRMIASLTGREVPAERLHGSVAAALIAVQRGAAIVRVHDVAATRDALAVWQAVTAVTPTRPAAAPRSAASSLFDDE